MKTLAIIGAIVVCLLIAGGSYYYVQTSQQAEASNSAQQAKQEFLSERGGEEYANRPITGMVESIAGQTLTVKSPMDDTATTVQIGDQTTIWVPQTVTLDDLKVGERISASGSEEGEVFQASMLQVGVPERAVQGPLGTPQALLTNENGEVITVTEDLQVARPGEGGASPPATNREPLGGPGNAPDMVVMQMVAGVIEEIGQDEIVVKRDDGTSATIKLAENARIERRTQGSSADIKEGNMVIVSGRLEEGVFNASEIEVNAGAIHIEKR